MQLAPEKALDSLDEVAAKYHGTRADHNILSASIAVLREIIVQWRKFTEEEKKRQREALEVASSITTEDKIKGTPTNLSVVKKKSR